jgi:hypothetical protein
MNCEDRGAEHTRANAMTSDPYRRPAAEPGQDVAGRDPLGWFEQQIAGASSPPADHDLLGVEGVDRVRNPDTDTFAPDRDDLA